jgi:phosphoribosylformylglycinamidine synthase
MIFYLKVYLGDETLSVLEIWGAEYQENNAFLIDAKDKDVVQAIADRENCPVRFLGEVTGDGKVTVHDSRDNSTPVDLPLELVLGKMPQKTFVDNHMESQLQPLELPADATIATALDRVLRLVTVGSKRFLVHKVDRSVTGLCAQQQCVGPLQLPLADVGVAAHSHFGITGTAVACGEQPIKGLVDSAAMARMTVAEAMTNIMWAKMSKIEDIKASGNWMYAAKLPGEGAKMYDACQALRDALITLGVSIDGGKDSLSMAARCGEEVVMAPGELTLTCYVTCPDITKTVTPDLKCPEGGSHLVYVDLGGGKARLGGSALAQVYSQIGNESPDIENFALLKAAVNLTQDFIDKGLILAGHDRSDGGLIVTLLEMAFAGNCAIDVTLPSSDLDAIQVLFSEEAGFVIEVDSSNMSDIIDAYVKEGLLAYHVGSVLAGDFIKVSIGADKPVLEAKMTELRDVWEATSFQLEKRQRNPICVAQEQKGLKSRKAPQWSLSFTPEPTEPSLIQSEKKHKVAIIRQEGSNGDREMVAAFLAAGFEAWDVTSSDLLNGNVTLDEFRGIVFVGGFSFADVLDSGKGWAGVIKFNPNVIEQFDKFRRRKDTFSLGICNGCQLMALLGWIPFTDLPEEKQPRLLHNDSAKYESRFISVKLEASPSVLLQGMEGSSMGVWVAHGEGRFHFPDPQVLDTVKEKNLAPIRYVNDVNEVTEEYPFNPNGSPEGIAALCSDDGRHLAMMPHPERVHTTWQWPWMPADWKNLKASPWLKMFQNARIFCDEN